MKAKLNREMIKNLQFQGAISGAVAHDLGEELEQMEYRIEELENKNRKANYIINSIMDKLYSNREQMKLEDILKNIDTILLKVEVYDKLKDSQKYVELGKALEYAIKKGYFIQDESDTLLDHSLKKNTLCDGDSLLDWYRKEVKNV